jgi:hypoxanthine phosphoribosyltransferase
MSRATILREQASSDPGHDREQRRNPGARERSAALTQEALPPLRWQLQPDDDRFAHPAEIELARLLTFYGVRWAYEPTTFAVRWRSDGRPEEFVTPDFYLPDHDLYLELTTMRQRLVTRKNRKFRLLRQAYPNLRVRLLYLRDLERLRDAFGPEARRSEPRLGSMLVAAGEVETRITELASELVARWDATGHDWRSRPLLLGAGPGSRRFLASLGASLLQQGVPIDIDQLAVSSIHGQQQAAARAKVVQPPATPLGGRLVVIAQEVLSTGLSTAFLTSWLRRRGAAEVEVCALLDRAAARIVDAPLACSGFAAPDVALVGYGLTRWREFRDLPFIAEVETR